MERLRPFIDARRAEIITELETFLARKRAELQRVSPLGPDACSRLQEFASRGKMIRGALLCYAASLGRADSATAVRAGAAMEILQSALLIHDDIMDHDTERRGRPSIHHQYAEQARLEGLRDAAHFGESQGISVGDVAFFMAFELLSTLQADALTRARLVELFARELSLVGVAQMMDMAAAASAREQTVEEILRLYLYKTGRYTFSLPLAAGATLGGLEERRIATLEETGELLGMLFQIRDDELGLFGDPDELGKPVGSDIREGKKTVFHALLLQSARAEDQARIRALWGSPDLGEAEVAFLLGAIERSGARAKVHEIVRSLADRARALVDRQGEGLLSEMLAYTLERIR